VQHEELILKQNKIKELREKITASSIKHDHARTNLQQVIQTRRFHLSEQKEKLEQALFHGKDLVNETNKNVRSLETTGFERDSITPPTKQPPSSSLSSSNEGLMQIKTELLRTEIQTDHDLRLWKKWPQLIQDKATSMSKANDQRREEIRLLERIMIGYETYCRDHNLKGPYDVADDVGDVGEVPMMMNENQKGPDDVTDDVGVATGNEEENPRMVNHDRNESNDDVTNDIVVVEVETAKEEPMIVEEDNACCHSDINNPSPMIRLEENSTNHSTNESMIDIAAHDDMSEFSVATVPDSSMHHP
jgi:hypothetical protein